MGFFRAVIHLFLKHYFSKNLKETKWCGKTLGMKTVYARVYSEKSTT